MSTMTPNMNLVLPTIGVDSGLVWEQSVNANTSILDSHNHTSGSGSPIPISAIMVTEDFDMAGFSLIQMKDITFISQSMVTPANMSLYVDGVDLHYVDGSGNDIPLTLGGAVNATSSGIVNGSATASFVSGVLVVNAAALTPADIQGASLLLGNTGIASSHYITLSPPSSLASDYTLKLPLIPSGDAFVTLDSSGNFGTQVFRSVVVSASCGAGASVPVGSTYTAITNLSVTLTTTGRPVVITLISDGSGNQASIETLHFITLVIQRDSVTPYTSTVIIENDAAGEAWPPGVINHVDFTANTPGSHTYTLLGRSLGGGGGGLSYIQLVAYEL